MKILIKLGTFHEQTFEKDGKKQDQRICKVITSFITCDIISADWYKPHSPLTIAVNSHKTENKPSSFID